MNHLIAYLLKVILCSAIFFAYYRLALRNKNFHPYNRFYLLSTAILSALLPLLHISMFDFSSDNERMLALFQLMGSGQLLDVVVTTGPKPINWELALLLSSLGVTLVLICLIMVRIYRVFSIKRKFPRKTVDNINFINTNIEQAPFSFLNNLFWRKDILLSDSVGKQIYQHELAHIQQKHSLDKLLMQVLCAVFWMNPIYYYMQRELGLIHEFMADQKAVEEGDAEAFARMLLATQFSGFRFEPAHSLSYSSIKKRLHMITNSHKPKYSYLRRLLFLPLLFTVTFVFALRAHQNKIADQTADLQAMVNAQKADDLKLIEPGQTKQIMAGTVTFAGADSTRPNDTTKIKFTSPDRPAPLIIVDGQQMPSSYSLDDLDASDIESMDVHKDKATTSKYGKKGINGVVVITTRHAAAKANKAITVVGFKKGDTTHRFSPPKVVKDEPVDVASTPNEITVTGYKTTDKPNNAIGVSAGSGGFKTQNALFIVDGIKTNKKELKTISPNDIASISVLKDGAATKVYGQDAAEGVVIVQTKAYVKQHPELQPKGTHVDHEASFPGGPEAWRKFLEVNLRTRILVDNNAPAGTYPVTVSFLVDKQGNISEVKAINQPKEDYGTGAEAVRVIKRSGKWLPATIDGKPVVFRQKQKIIFKVAQ
ncbi:hypothetical protein GCM10027566_10460 [Arachidicoccus ginsenosidivorans]|nr:M56 family metallopeptidase [Arachidicoccus ginsenosidivorans]